MSVILKYPLDLTGKSSNNLITGEVHTLPVGVNRAFVASYGPFYTASLIVRESVTNRLLTANVHYKAIQLDVDATAESGLEVCSVIVITDQAVANRVTIQYQVVGGEYSTSVYALQQMIDALNLDNRTVAWGDILGKPSEYAPAEHRHDAGDLYGFEYLVAAIEELRQAIIIGDDASHDAIYKYVDLKNSNQDTTLATYKLTMNTHIASTANPHHVTAVQVGLGNVQNYGIATVAEAQAGVSNTVYMTPLRVKDAIAKIAGDSLGTHLTDINNPHQVTKVQVGLGVVQNFGLATDAEAQAGSSNAKYMTPYLVKKALETIDVDNALHLENKSLAQIIADVKLLTVAGADKLDGNTHQQLKTEWGGDITSALGAYVKTSAVNSAGTATWAAIVGKTPIVQTNGVMEIGKYIDFHDTNSVADYDVRLGIAGTQLRVTGGLYWSGVAAGDGTNITNVNAPKLGGRAAADYALKSDLTALQGGMQLFRGTEGSGVVYVKLAELVTVIGSSGNDVTLLISGLENFGSTFGSSAIVRMGTRNTGANLEATLLCGSLTSSSEIGYVKTAGGKTELWVKSSTYRNKLTATILNNNGATTMSVVSSVMPTGYTAITMDRFWKASEKVSTAVTADKLGEYTPATLSTWILGGTAANATKFSNKTLTEVMTDVGNSTVANSNKLASKTLAQIMDDVEASTVANALKFNAKTYTETKDDILAAAASSAQSKYLALTDVVSGGKYENLINNVPRIGNTGYFELGNSVRFHLPGSAVDPDLVVNIAKVSDAAGAIPQISEMLVYGNIRLANGNYKFTGSGVGLTSVNAAEFGGRTYAETKADFQATFDARYVEWSDVAKTATTYATAINKVPYVASNGVTEIGRILDFRVLDSTSTDYDIRLDCRSREYTNIDWVNSANVAAVKTTKELYATRLATSFMRVESGIGLEYGNRANQLNFNGGDRADLGAANNVNIRTWYGFSVQSSCIDDLAAWNKVAFSVNGRTGDVRFRGTAYGNGAGLSNVNAQTLDGKDSTAFELAQSVTHKAIGCTIYRHSNDWINTGFWLQSGAAYIVRVAWEVPGTNGYWSYYNGAFVIAGVSGSGHSYFDTVTGEVNGTGAYGESASWRVQRNTALEICMHGDGGDANLSHQKRVGTTLHVYIKRIF